MVVVDFYWHCFATFPGEKKMSVVVVLAAAGEKSAEKRIETLVVTLD